MNIRAIMIIAQVVLSLFSFSSSADTRVFVRDLGDEIYAEIKGADGTVIFDELVQFPFSPVSILSGVDDSTYPHNYSFYNIEGESHLYRVSLGQDPLFYIEGSIKKHFTFMPKVKDGLVTLSNPETGEVFFTTVTDGQGAFEVASTQIPSDTHEFTKVSISGGYAYWLERDATNELVAVVRTDSLVRGSVTVSMPTTAAYLAASENKELFLQRDFYKVLNANHMKVSRTFSSPVSQYSYENAYFSHEPKALEQAHGLDNEEFITRKILYSDEFPEYFSGSLLELMASPIDKQKNGLWQYFPTLEGWQGVPSSANSHTLNVSVIGEGGVNISVFTMDNQTLSKNYRIERDLTGQRVHPNYPVYSLSPTILSDDEHVILTALPDDGWGFVMWSGCIDDYSLKCKVKKGTDKVSLYLEKKTENREPTANIDTSLFRFANGVLVGRDDMSLDQYHFLNDVAIGDTVRNQDGYIFTVDNIVYSPQLLLGSEISISLIYKPFKGDFYQLSNSMDYWRFFIGDDSTYEPGTVIPVFADDELNQGVGILLSDDPFSKGVMVGELTTEPEFIGNIYSLQSNEATAKSCYEKSTPSVLSNSFGGVSICFSENFTFNFLDISILTSNASGLTTYKIPVELFGSIELSANIKEDFSRNVSLSPPIVFKGSVSADIAKLTFNSNTKGHVIISTASNFIFDSSVSKSLSNRNNYSLSIGSASSPGSLKLGVYGGATISRNAEATIGASASGKINTVRKRVDPNGICGFESIEGFNLSSAAFLKQN